MAGFAIKIIGASKILKVLRSKDTIQGPMNKGVKQTTLKMEGLTKKATVVASGRLRSSITHQITKSRGLVGTNVKYAPFVEYGTRNMKARHASRGKARILGLGMFGHALKQLHKWLGNAEKDIARGIEKRFK